MSPPPQHHNTQQPDDEHTSQAQNQPDLSSIPRLFPISTKSELLVTQIGNALAEVGLEIVNLLRRGRVRQVSVRVEIDAPAPLAQLFGRHLAPGVPHDRIGVAVAHENRRVLVWRLGRHHVLDLVLEQQIARQAEDAAQLRRAGDTGHQAHGAALAEAAQHDALRRDARVDLVLDERVEDFLRAQHARLILAAVRQVAKVGDVVPSGHTHAHVDRDGNARCVGEDEFGLGELVAGAPLLGEEGP